MIMGNAKADVTLTVALVGVSSRSRAVLNMFFATKAGHFCRLVEDLSQAQVGIVDLDGPQASKILAEYRRAFRGPTLAMSVRDPELDDTVWLAKPVKTNALLAALMALRKLLTQAAPIAIAAPQEITPEPAPSVEKGSSDSPATERGEPTLKAASMASEAALDATPPDTDETATPSTAVAKPDKAAMRASNASDVRRAAGLAETERRRHPSYGTLDDADYKDPKQRHHSFYDPMAYLQGAVQKAFEVARDRQRPLRLKIQSDGIGLVIFPDRLEVQSEIREHLLRSLSMVKHGGDSVTVELLSADTKPSLSSNDARLQTQSGLSWKIALWTSLGRAPIGTDPSQPVTLLRWPNFTRVFISKHAIRIAALWSQQPTSLFDTARILEIEHRYVFSFYAAASAIGIVAYGDSIDSKHRPGGKTTQSGILGRLLTYLGARD